MGKEEQVLVRLWAQGVVHVSLARLVEVLQCWAHCHRARHAEAESAQSNEFDWQGHVQLREDNQAIDTEAARR